MFLEYCLNNLDLSQQDQFEEYFSCVAVCAINAVFSINTKYQAVANALNRFCDYFNLEQTHPIKGCIPPANTQKTVSEVYNLMKDYSPDILAADIFQNRQRTSTANGILKADASLRFLKILQQFEVELYQDVPKIRGNDAFEDGIKSIPGQGSGISLQYFYMLTGSKDQIKPDRMIIRFIKEATGETVTTDEALKIIRQTVEELKMKGYADMSARRLDNIIWNFQRVQGI